MCDGIILGLAIAVAVAGLPIFIISVAEFYQELLSQARSWWRRL